MNSRKLIAQFNNTIAVKIKAHRIKMKRITMEMNKKDMLESMALRLEFMRPQALCHFKIIHIAHIKV